MTQLA